MPNRDDEKFESYLKQFRPVVPEAPPVKVHVRKKRPLLFSAWAAVAAAILAAVILSWRFYHPVSVNKNIAGGQRVERLANPQSLTIGSANALLESAPSFNAAVESVAFQSDSKPLSGNGHSAFAVLSKEESK